jgi:hypothetical protein
MRPLTPHALVLVGLAVIAPACRKGSEPATRNAETPAPAIAGADARPLSPAHRELAAEFGESIAKQLTEGRLKAVADDIDWNPLTEAAFAGIDWESNPKWKELRDTLDRRVRADPAQLLANLEGTRARFLRLRDTSAGTAALVRCVMPGGASTYFDFFPRFHPDGSAHLANIYNHASGLTIPEALRAILLTLAPANDRTLWQRLFHGSESTDPALLESLDTALRTRNPGAVGEVWPKLPPALRAQRPLLMSAIQILMLDPDSPAYLAVLDEARTRYADEPLADLLSIDFHYLKKDLAGLEACLDRIAQRLGGIDANLLTLRASGRFLAGAYDACQESLAEALALEPDFEGAHQTRLQLLITQRDFAGAVAQLGEITDRFRRPFPPPTARDNPALDAFLASPEFAKWRAAHPE